MSTNLYWRPVPKNKTSLDDRLKHILKETYRIENWRDPVTLNSDQLPYLTGLKDGGVPDADKLIAAIQKHGEVEIWIDE